MSYPTFIGPRSGTSSPQNTADSWHGSGLSFVTNTTSFPNPNGTKIYYVSQGQSSSGSTLGYIYFDTSDNKWHDAGQNNPFAFRVGAIGSETPAVSSFPTYSSNYASPAVASGDNVIVYRNGPTRALMEFTQPSGFYASAVTWAQNFTNSGTRDLRVTFTPSVLGGYKVTTEQNTQNAVIEHWSSTGNLAAGTQQVITFKANTNTNNQLFALVHSTGTFGTILDDHTPVTVIDPDITPTWPTQLTNNSGVYEFEITFATSGIHDMYFGADGDEIQVIDGNGAVYGTAQLTSTWNYKLTATNVFGATEYSPKTFKLQLKNSTHGKTTFHDFNWNTGNKTYTYDSPHYNISNVSWSVAVANQVRVSYTQNNRNNAEVVELWKSNGSSAVYTDTTGGSLLTYNMTSTADDGTYLLKVGNTTWSTSSITYSYQAPAHNIVVNPPGFTTTWTDDLNSGGTTVSATVRATNNGTSTGYIYLWETGNNTPVDSWIVSTHPTSTFVNVMSYTSASANTVYYLTIEGSNTTVLSHTTGSAPYVFTFGSWDTSVTNQVRATFTQSNPTGSETVTLTHPTDSSKNVTVNHLVTEVTFTMTGTADDGTYSIGTEQQNYSYSAPAPPAPPVTSNTPSGGGIKRYPMVLTQLFNKKRSFYSIGMTHKDGQLQCFL